METVTFSFGKNWENFVKTCYSEERLRISKKWILDFLELPDLKGKTFMDVGSGSGLSSLAVFESGADRVISFDVDPKSVTTTKKLWEMKGSPRNWEIIEASILDDEILSSYPKADIVYSWGVLHHTGDLWKALKNASQLVKDGGHFYVAVYLKDEMSHFWKWIKKSYNRSSWVVKKMMECWYIYKFAFRRNLLRPWKPIKSILGYKKLRGMAFYTDLKDWLGGWPYEPATQEEICQFCRELGFKKIKTHMVGNVVEYLFQKEAQRT